MKNVLAEEGGLGEVCWWFFPVGGSMVYGGLSWSFEGRLGSDYIRGTCSKNCILDYR